MSVQQSLEITQRAPAPASPGRLSKLLRAPSVLRERLRARQQLSRCDSVHSSVRMRGKAIVDNDGCVTIGDHVNIDARVVPFELVTSPTGRITIGSGVYINFGVSISAYDHVSIGDGCQIGKHTLIMDNDHHDVADHLQPGKIAPVVIEEHAWIGARATILKGVRIGRGSVIAAGSVVTRDVPAGTVAAGVPARVIRQI